jgi:hypothetical protein
MALGSKSTCGDEHGSALNPPRRTTEMRAPGRCLEPQRHFTARSGWSPMPHNTPPAPEPAVLSLYCSLAVVMAFDAGLGYWVQGFAAGAQGPAFISKRADGPKCTCGSERPGRLVGEFAASMRAVFGRLDEAVCAVPFGKRDRILLTCGLAPTRGSTRTLG